MIAHAEFEHLFARFFELNNRARRQFHNLREGLLLHRQRYADRHFDIQQILRIAGVQIAHRGCDVGFVRRWLRRCNSIALRLRWCDGLIGHEIGSQHVA